MVKSILVLLLLIVVIPLIVMAGPGISDRNRPPYDRVTKTKLLKPGNYYFTAEWCGYCVDQTKVVKQLEAEGYKFTTFDYDRDTKVFKDNGVKGLPTIIIVKNGGKILKLKGLQSAKKLRGLL